MANTTTFSMGIGTTLDYSGLDAGIQQIYNITKSIKPVVIDTKISGGADIGSAQSILDKIKEQATAIESVTVRQKTFTDELNETYSVIDRVTTKWIDGNGKVQESIDNIAVSLRGTEDKLINTTSVTDPIGKRAREISSYYDKEAKEFDKMTTKATEWYTRSEKMSQKEKESIQSSVEALREKVEAYKSLVQSGNLEEANRMAQEIRTQNVVVEENIAKSKRAANAVRGWADNLTNAIKQTISYTFSLGMLRAAQQSLNETIQFTIDLNTEMVKIQLLQVEGARTPEDIRNLALSYNTLAKELSATTKEIAQGSVEWLRQGKTVAETTDLLRASTMLAKLGNMSAAESTEYLTSVLNGYNMEAEEAIGIVDKLIAVDNIAATSAKELATALRYSSAVAAQAGVPIETLISYIGTLSSTTRQNAEMIGQALKTIFTRMQDIKQGGLDEDGLGINNVERALARVDVKLRDSATSFRDMDAVLQDLAAKWSTLNEVEQANIAKSIAGVRQQNMFLILMTEMNQALGYQEEQMNATGLATERYGIYVESIEAKQAKLKASLEGLFLTAKGFDGLISKFLDFATSLTELVTTLGGLPTILIAVVSAIALFTGGNIQASIATSLATSATFTFSSSLGKLIVALFTTGIASEATAVAFQTLTASIGMTMLTNPIGWFIALAGAVYVLAKLIPSAREQFDKLNETIKEYRNQISELSNQKSQISDLVKAFKDLKEEQKSGKDVTQELYDVQNKLKEMMPQLNGYYDDYGNFIVDATNDMNGLTNATDAQIASLKEKIQLDAEASSKATAKALKEAKANMQAVENYNQSKLDMGFKLAPKDKLAAANAAAEYESVLADSMGQFEVMGREFQNRFIDGFTDPDLKKLFADEFGKIVAGAKEKIQNAVMSSKEKQLGFSLLPRLGDKEFLASMGRVEGSLKNYSDLKDKIAKGGFVFTEEELNILQEAEISYETTADGIKLMEGADKALTDSIYKEITASNTLTDAQKAVLLATLDLSSANEEQVRTIEQIISAQSYLSDALDEYNATGSLSVETALKLIDNGYAAAVAYNYETGALYLNIDALRNVQRAQIDAAVADAHAAAIAAGSVTSHDAETQALWRKYEALLHVKGLMTDANYMPVTMGYTPAGGGGGSATNPEVEKLKEQKEAIQDQIDVIEDQKKALKDRLDDFKDYIDAQKESLKLQKEEADFSKSLMEKEQKLAKLKVQIALLGLDNSEEARNKRIKLEEEAAKLSEDIEGDKEDRIYDLKVEALDKANDDFADSINLQIEGLDKTIDKLRDQMKAIDETISKFGSGGGGGGGGGGLSKAVIDYSKTFDEAYGYILDAMNQGISLTDTEKESIVKMAEKMFEAGATADEVHQKIRAAIGAMIELNRVASLGGTGGGQSGVSCFVGGTRISMWDGTTKKIENIHPGDIVLSQDIEGNTKTSGLVTVAFVHTVNKHYIINNALYVTGEHPVYVVDKGWLEVKKVEYGDKLYAQNGDFIEVNEISILSSSGDIKVYNLEVSNHHNYFAENILVHNKIIEEHQGGIIPETHHIGDFAGGLKSNEVFAKLLKGEYVATEGQMDDFLRKTLPKILANNSLPPKTGSVSNGSVKDVKVEITFNGDVNSTDIPSIEKVVLRSVNSALRQTGLRRNAGSYGI